MGVITSGAAYQYVKEALPDFHLEAGANFSLTPKLIKSFVQQVERSYVVEELEPFWKNRLSPGGCRSLGRRFSQGGRTKSRTGSGKFDRRKASEETSWRGSRYCPRPLVCVQDVPTGDLLRSEPSQTSSLR